MIGRANRSSRTRRSTGVVATVVIGVASVSLALSACSSSSSSSASAPSSASAASTSSAASSSSPSASGSTASANVTAATAAAQVAEQAPTSISVSTPLKSKPATGKTFVWMNCNVDTCTPIGQGIKAAVTALGWNFREIQFNASDPATLVQGMQQALQYHPAYVALSGLAPETGWSSVIPAYKAAGVKIIATFLGKETFNSTFIANVGGATLATDDGVTLANWFISNSNGQGQAVLQRVDDFATLKLVADSFAATVAAKCPDCKVLNLNNTVAQASSGGVVPAVISTLRSNPSYDYVIASSSDLVTGLPAALASVGLTGKVKFAGSSSNTASLAALKAGQAAAFTGNPLGYVGWQAVDTAARDSEGMSFVPDPHVPFQLLVPGSTFAVTTSQNVPADYEAQFEKLWHVG
jgi:ribose transport system substrate-binding protein